MTQRKALLIDAGHQVFDELDAPDLPDLSGTYDASGAAATAASGAASALSTHAAAADPHPGYLTPTEGNAAYDAAGAAAAAAAASAPTSRTITAGTGLTGGGTLAADRTLAADFGSGAGKVTQGNDARLTDSRAPSGAAGGGLAGTYPNPTVGTNANLTGPVTSVGNATKFTPGAVHLWRLQSWLTGCLAENMPRWAADANSNVLSTGRLSSFALQVLAGTPCTNLAFHSATTALGTPTNWWFALCDASYNLIRQSTDQLATAWAADTLMPLAMDSVPCTAGARAGSTTVTLTFPTLSEALSTLFAPGDSIVVTNANVAAYNGTFTVVSVTSTTITYVCGGSATDSLSAPFPTVQLAAGKRVYTPAADALLYAVIMAKGGAVPTLDGRATRASTFGPASTSGNTGLTGTCPSPITHGTGAGGATFWAGIS